MDTIIGMEIGVGFVVFVLLMVYLFGPSDNPPGGW